MDSKNAFTYVSLILNMNDPFTQKGLHKGISFLFAMEDIFEKYVAKVLSQNLAKNYKLETKGSKKYLAKQSGKEAFILKPDILISKDDKVNCILDTKWKKIDTEENLHNNGKKR